MLQLEVPLVALSLMKVSVTVPQPPEVLPPVKSCAGTKLKHWTVVSAGQLIVRATQVGVGVGVGVLVAEGVAVAVAVAVGVGLAVAVGEAVGVDVAVAVGVDVGVGVGLVAP